MKHLDITITGKVQGVFFRAMSKAVADQLGIKGTARNCPDGSVFIEAEGDDFSLDMFLEFCRKGSDRSVVENVTAMGAELKNYTNFEVVKR
ncbi:acylphosphatase [Daejeonella sp. H1SJ63]|uniref:acylphosphatase n=1 Tax=Daejeonella sp. H1SJ63 TaxID=3034145 RepID=UPI0023EB28F2|nr:acylphosphatase [Daejeonella sp. H1SJ63]